MPFKCIPRNIISKDEWGTPLKIFRPLDNEFNFTLDPCARSDRPLKYGITNCDIRKGVDGLKYSWKDHKVFVNPPYSADNIKKWVQKAYSERNNAEIIVMLIPVRTDRKYFHEYILNKAEIRFIKGRPSFYPLEGQNDGTPSFPSMIIIWYKDKNIVF
jgi:site-specific DNA-methyltransferase (adenine-specific)